MNSFSTIDSTVNSFYLAFYGRPADPAGLKFWSQQVADNNGDLAPIAQAFATSAEAQARFGNDSTSARITEIYQQLFNRAPDTEGLAYWTLAVARGEATLAEVSLSILKGAQGSDDTLSAMRQKAADAFTAAVEDGSTEYSGYASIEAARVLVRAVTADATDADLAKLVKAAVSFADTATRNPMVVEAIATGSTLLNLYDSARGTKDPVALTQALADTAKAAAGDPVTLESLLRGGGMDKVLKVMPAKATLTDVVEALAKGGLPAAVEVVYPTKPVVVPTPTPVATALDLKFASVSQGELDSNKSDNVTNVKDATVKFSYTGSDLKAGQGFQYSIDGVSWTSKGVSVDAATNVVTIKSVNLAGDTLVQPNNIGVSTMTVPHPVANTITTVQLQAVDANNGVLAKASGKIEYDGTAPTKSLYYIGRGSDAQPALTFGQYGGVEGLVQWRLNSAESKWTDVTKFNEDGGFTLTGIDLEKTGQRLEMRVIDAAGNVGYTSSQDVEGPAQPLQFKLTPTSSGLQVESGKGFDVRLYLEADRYAPLGTVNGVNGGVASIGAQPFMARSGELRIALNATNEETVIESGNRYTFGTDANDSGTLTGNYVWGFNGNDLISGTMGNDYLVGGAGADRIYLPNDGQSDVDTLVFAKGHTATGVYTGAVIAIDQITGAGIGDVIQLDKVFTAAPVITSAFLASGDLNQVAIVRGVLASDGTFEAGSDGYHQDYMIQWSDGQTVNSIMLESYGVVPPALTVDIATGTMTLVQPGVTPTPTPTPTPVDPQPAPIELAPSDYRLYFSDRTISLETNAGPVTAMNPDKLSLTMHASGTPLDAFTKFSLVDGKLQFAGSLFPNLYVMQWEGETFEVGSGAAARFVESGSSMFAGGTLGRFTHTGFKVDTMFGTQAGTVRDSASLESEAFFSGAGETFVVTGGGHDVIMGTVGRTGDHLLLGYHSFDTDASDLVLRFRSGGDKVVFSDQAERIIDKDDNGSIKWSNAENNGVVVAGDEAVSARVTSDIIVGDTANMVFTAGALKNAIDVSSVAKGDGLLILASGANSAAAAALFYYMAQDDNGQIDANELTTVAMFLTGVAPVEADIKLAGVNDIIET